MKNKGLLITLGVLGIIIIYAISTYNSMVGSEENVIKQWANVENVYQRRADLIPNLVSTVKGYATHEKEVFTQVTEARSKVGSIQIDPSKLDEASIQRFQQAQEGLSSALSRLIAVSENYPTLKANENFLQLQSQLEGTENRIAVERGRYNEEVAVYNKSIRKFPAAMFAGMFGFERKTPFAAQAGAENAPKVQF